MTNEEWYARNLARRRATLVIVFAHLGLALLQLANRLQYHDIQTELETVYWIATTRMWIPLHLFNAGVLTWGIMHHGRNRLLNRALSLSVAFIGVWSFFTLMLGLSSTDGEVVPLAAPFLGLVVTAFSQALRGSYFPFAPPAPEHDRE